MESRTGRSKQRKYAAESTPDRLSFKSRGAMFAVFFSESSPGQRTKLTPLLDRLQLEG